MNKNRSGSADRAHVPNASAEDAADIRTFVEFQRKVESGEEELSPSEIVDRLLSGESRIKVCREYRGLTATALAERAGIVQAFLSQIETGKRDGTVDTLLELAAVLRVSLDDLVEQKNVRIERIIHHQPGLTIAEIVTRIGASESQVRKTTDWLMNEGQAMKRGQPLRLYPPEV